MADEHRGRESGRGDESRRDDRGFAGPRREPRVPEHDGRGYDRPFDADIYSGESRREGRDWRPVQDEQEGFWGRGHRGSGYDRDERREYSREDYGASNRGGRDRGGYYGGSFSRTGEEGRGGQGYGWQRDEFGREASGRSYTGNDGRGFGYGSDQRSSYGGSGYGGGDRGREGYGHRGSDRGFFERAADEVSSWFGDRDAEQRREADYRGRGPKGYKRSDGRVQEDVSDRLADDSYVDASEIEVTVSGGEVTLTGSVDSRQARRRAEDIAEQVSGVGYVQNNLRIRTGGGETAAVGTGSGAGLGQGTTATTETAGQNKRI